MQLQAKEGLALINGTQYQCAVGALVLARALELADVADVAGAFSADVFRSTDRAFDERIHRVRGLRGQQIVAAHLRALMEGSQIRESHRTDDPRVQDAYSIRCMPQVHGASRDALEYVRTIIEAELNAANDNPLIFPEGEHLEGGNFHASHLRLHSIRWQSLLQSLPTSASGASSEWSMVPSATGCRNFSHQTLDSKVE